VALKADDSGLLATQLSGHDSDTLIGDGEGGSTLGSYATTPTAGTYPYVAQAQAPLAEGGNVAALMAGSKWTSLDAPSAKTIVTYSFADPLTSTFAYANNDFQSTLSTFSGADRQLTRDLLAHIEAVCNVQFVEVADNAEQCGVLRYGYSHEPNAMNFAGYAFFPSAGAIGGDIWIGADQAAAQWDFYRPDLILHETLHALGLKHPFSAGEVLSTEQDIIPNTVMSYSTVAGSDGGGYMSSYPGEPMGLDIAALQYLYGASALNAGNTVYDLAGAAFQGGFHAVWDAGGVDTFNASRVGHGVVLNLNEGASSNIGVTVTANGSVGGTAVSTDYTATLSIAAGAVIESAVGSAFADTLIGNAAGNWLEGGAGNDTLAGQGGNDILVGGAGNDVLDGGEGIDMAVYASSRESYTIARTANGVSVSGVDGTDLLVGVERLSFSDGQLALDLAGEAGTVAKVIGAVFGADCVHNAQYVGIGLNLIDNGMSSQDLVALALGCRLGADPSNDAVVELLYENLFGSAPAAAQKDGFVALLDQDALSQESLGQIAADHALNTAHIDLVGLSAAGLEYAA
jgi:hypothetical protein